MRFQFLILLLLMGCGKVTFKPGADSVLGGRILPLMGVAQTRSYLIQSAYASVTCSDDVYARLHKVETDGTLNSIPVASYLVKNNKYEFKIDELPLDIHSANVSYQIAIIGCDDSFFRPVTGVNADQDITYASTIVGMSSLATLLKPLSQVEKIEVESLINRIHGASLIQAYTNLNSNPALSTTFHELFLDLPVKLAESHPNVTLVSFASIVNEGLSSTFKVSSLHFEPAYDIAQEWLLDGAPVSIANQWVFSPGADAAGTYVVTSIVGHNDGAGNVDRNKPFYTHAQAVTVLNTLPAVAPDFVMISDASNSGAFSLKVHTGIAQEDCESFKFFLFTTSAIKPLPSNSGFTKICSVDVEQPETVILTGVDGARTLSLWVKDSNGIVSNSAFTQTVYLDTTPPVAAVSAPGTILKGATVRTVSLAASDALTGLQTLKLQYASDGSTFIDLSNLALTATSYSWTLPGHNTVMAKLKLLATDRAGNTTSSESAAFTIDSAAPTAPAVALVSANPTNSVTATLTITSCTDRAMIFASSVATAPLSTDPDWQVCTTGAGATTATLSTGDGAKTIYVWAQDVAGNVSTAATVTTVLDQTVPGAPAILFTSNSATAEKKTTTATTLTVSSCTDRTKVLVTRSTSTPLVDDVGWQNCVTSAGGIAFTLTTPVEDNHALKAWAKDGAGNISPSTALGFIYDITAPIVTSINVNSGISTTGNNNLVISLTSSSSRQDISSFCFKYNESTTPLAADSCWTTLASIGYPLTNSFTLSSYPYQIGTILGIYDIRVWLKDDLGNISTISNTINIDLFSMNYQPDPPPTVSNAIASSSDTPSNPLNTADTTATIASDVFIRWNITDNAAIPNGNISLYYTTNESTYTLITSGLNNSENGACTVDAGSSGCFKWTAASPLSSYYKIKIAVTDSGISSVFSMTNPLNNGNISFLSGNTSLGIGASANSAILLGEGEAAYNDNHDNGALAVTKTGHIFFKYKGFGLVYISPETGLLNVLIPQTGTYSGNGVNATSATLRSLSRITLDFEGNILLWDYDRIRKITLSVTPWRIDTIVGGGADASDGAPALSASISTTNNVNLFTTVPNGRIYYQKGKEIWFFDPTDSKVKKHLSLGGIGTSTMAGVNAAYNNDTCPMSFTTFAFDKTTSAITKIMRKGGMNTNPECGNLAPGTYTAGHNTNFNSTTGVSEAPHPISMDWTTTSFTGLDGKIYLLPQGRAYLQRYNPVTNLYENIIGNGTSGRCVDGTPAASCPMIVMSAFINEFGKIFFLDMGVIRTIDQNGNVQTIAGQPRNYGIGSNPISARFSKIAFFDVSGNDVYVQNKLENQIVKFSLAGGTLQHVAGNGISGSPAHDSTATTSKLANCGWSMPCGLKIDAANNRLYQTATSGYLSYINLTTGKWFIENYVVQSGARISFIGLNSDGLLAYVPIHGGTTSNVTLRVINQNTLSNTIIYGKNQQLAGNATSLCSGMAGTDCTLAGTLGEDVQTQTKYDVTLDSWLLAYKARNQINTISALGGTVTPFTTTVQNFEAYEFQRVGGNEFVFYCGTNGNLYKRNVIAATETQLALPTSTMKCVGQSLQYHSGRNSLIFIYLQNGLYGIAEYKNP
jgi:hypothetical protein